MDWRKRGINLGEVKNQGNCNSCYAFAATAVIEAQYSLDFNRTMSLSEQEIIDCSSENKGCEGGLIHLAVDYIYRNGLSVSRTYPGKSGPKKGNCDVDALDPDEMERVRRKR